MGKHANAAALALSLDIQSRYFDFQSHYIRNSTISKVKTLWWVFVIAIGSTFAIAS
jgi:hypothetical protein